MEKSAEGFARTHACPPCGIMPDSKEYEECSGVLIIAQSMPKLLTWDHPFICDLQSTILLHHLSPYLEEAGFLDMA